MKTVCVMSIVLLLMGMLTFSFTLQRVRAPELMAMEYIYIRANGTIDPLEAPISTDDKVTYSLSDNIVNKSLVVERDNITINGGGWTISGTEELNSIGVNVTGRYNVTIRNTNIEKFDMGVHVIYSSMIRLDGNNVSNNRILYWMEPPFDYFWSGTGISVSRSNKTDIISNTASNDIFGICVYESNDTNVIGNNASGNNQHEDTTYYGTGISVYDSKNITIADNLVSNNGVMGINLASATMSYPCSNNTVRNNTITGHAFGAYSYGLYISMSRDNVIADNTIYSNIYGINVRYYSQNQTIRNNNVSSNTWGIYSEESTSNTISNNTFWKNAEGIRFENSSNNRILQNAILSSSSFGIYIRSYSSNNVLLGNNVSYNYNGVRFTESSNNHVLWNELSSSNSTGLVIYYYSSNNEVADNNISSNDKGTAITYDSYNTKVFHNNFINNAEHVYTDMNSTWDNSYPSGGNYWSNYTGSDFYSGTLQNETGSDGIGDVPHTINMNNTDHFPLMAPIIAFDAGTWEDTTNYVHVISNSTISDFKINVAEKTVNFNVTGETGFGFCRIIIPNVIIETLWNGNYTVMVNGLPVEFRNWTDMENTYIYFTYPHSTHEIVIIPEFPIASFATLLIIITTFVLTVKKRKQHQRLSSMT